MCSTIRLITNEARVDQVLSWLQLPIEQRPHFIGFYMTAEVDAVGHWYGPEPIEVGYVVRRVDAELGYVRDRLTMGSGIKQGVRIPAFENVHIYPLLADLLHLNSPQDIDIEQDG